MANRIVSVHAGIYGMGIYAIMLPSSGFSVAHYTASYTTLALEHMKTNRSDHTRRAVIFYTYSRYVDAVGLNSMKRPLAINNNPSISSNAFS